VTPDPFAARYDVPVAGGALRVARAGAEPESASSVVLAVHGIASSHLVWRAVARELAADTNVCLLAPDLRGRGHSAALPGPYGISAHVSDLLAVLDHAGVGQVVLVGHSLGAFIVSAFAAEHPDRVSAVVLLDGGLAIAGYPDDFADELVEAMVDAALELTRTPFETVEEHVTQWREHPAFADAWNDDVDSYARYDVAGEPGSLHAAVSERAVRADIAQLVRDERTRTAIDRIHAPIQLLRAPRGMQNALPMLPQLLIDSFVSIHPRARVEEVADVNHYTLVLGAGPGPAAVAAAVAEALVV
jgi:pimeloyl-ACP methyl ester carboxylesterase